MNFVRFKFPRESTHHVDKLDKKNVVLKQNPNCTARKNFYMIFLQCADVSETTKTFEIGFDPTFECDFFGGNFQSL